MHHEIFLFITRIISTEQIYVTFSRLKYWSLWRFITFLLNWYIIHIHTINISYRKVSWRLREAIFLFQLFQPTSNFTDRSAAMLFYLLSYFKVFLKFSTSKPPASELRAILRYNFQNKANRHNEIPSYLDVVILFFLFCICHMHTFILEQDPKRAYVLP